MTLAPSPAAVDVERWQKDLEGLLVSRAEPAWLRALRLSAFERFAERGFPTTRDEEFRQTNVARIAATAFSRPRPGSARDAAFAVVLENHCGPTAVFVDGRYSAEMSSSSGERGVEVRSLARMLAEAPSRVEALVREADAGGSAFSDLNAALHEDGAVVTVAPRTVVADPVHIVYLSTAAAAGPTASHPRSFVHAGEGSEVSIVESYAGPKGAAYLTNALTDVGLSEGARVRHFRWQRESDSAFHVGRTSVKVGRNASFHDHSVSFGAALSRHDIDVIFAGEGGDVVLDGLFLATGERHVDVHTRIDHAAPRCTSRQLYKGLLDGHGRGVFHGLVVVRAGAQKTDAVQSNKNLLLSRHALVSSTPQLEILADDVKCKHGSTTGQLDPAAVFYLRSRGIGEAEARGLLSRAFAGEIVQRISFSALRAAVEAELETRLAETLREGAAA